MATMQTTIVNHARQGNGFRSQQEIDNNNNEASANKNYVQAAIDAALKGETPETKETRARGCGIAYKSK